jgi:hypothetical protein
MDPITLTILAIMAIAGGSLAVVHWSTIQDWVWGHRVPQGTAEIIRQKLANGDFAVVAGTFSPWGRKIATHTWKAKELDSELEGEFWKAGGKIVVRF